MYRRNRRGLPAGACFDRTLQVIRLSGCTWVYSGNRQGQRLFRTHINKPRRSGGRSLYRSMLLWPGVEHRRPKHVRGPALCTRGRLLGQSPPSLAQCPVARCCQSQHYSTFATALPRSTDTCGAHCGAHRPQLFRTFLQASKRSTVGRQPLWNSGAHWLQARASWHHRGAPWAPRLPSHHQTNLPIYVRCARC